MMGLDWQNQEKYYRTEEDRWFDYIKGHYFELYRVPEEHQTRKVCEYALKKRGTNLEYVKNKESMTEELCFIAVTSQGEALEFVPEDLKTEKVCFAAVSKNPFAIEFVPESQITTELINHAMFLDARSLEKIKVQTRDLCVQAIMKDPRSIWGVKNQTVSLCKLALKQDLRCFEYIRAFGIFNVNPTTYRTFLGDDIITFVFEGVRYFYIEKYKCVQTKEDMIRTIKKGSQFVTIEEQNEYIKTIKKI